MSTAIDTFRSRIENAARVGSPAGERITYREATRALADLAGVDETEAVQAVRDVLDRSRLTAGGRLALSRFVQAHTEITAISEATTKRLREVFARQGELAWRDPGAALPLGVRFERVLLKDDTIACGRRYTALVPCGPLRPSGLKSDPNLATYFFVERSGGVPGTAQVAGPLPLARSSAGELKELLERDAQKRHDVIAAAYPQGYSRSAPPAITNVTSLDGKVFEVRVDLLRFPDQQVVDRKTVLVDIDPWRVWCTAPIAPQ